MDNLISNKKISTSEINKLKTKEYTKSLFLASDYPACFSKNENQFFDNDVCVEFR